MTISWYDGDRADIRHLFELADDSEVELTSYMNEGRVLVAWDDDRPVGHLQLIPAGDGDVELKSLAVVPELQRSGLGRQLIEAAVEAAVADGYVRMLVSTAGASTGNLRFYQRCGFRLLSIERDAFTPETGYPEQIYIDGIAMWDRVWMDRALTPAS